MDAAGLGLTFILIFEPLRELGEELGTEKDLDKTRIRSVCCPCV